MFADDTNLFHSSNKIKHLFELVKFLGVLLDENLLGKAISVA